MLVKDSLIAVPIIGFQLQTLLTATGVEAGCTPWGRVRPHFD
jgi:hypothetical protein